MKLYLAVDVSDDDVDLNEVVTQCGYDLKHPAVHDISAPEVADYHGESCLLLRLHLLPQALTDLSAGRLSAEQLLQEAEVLISHPSVSALRKLWLEA